MTAGSTVREPMTATATTRIVDRPMLMNVALSVSRCRPWRPSRSGRRAGRRGPRWRRRCRSRRACRGPWRAPRAGGGCRRASSRRRPRGRSQDRRLRDRIHRHHVADDATRPPVPKTAVTASSSGTEAAMSAPKTMNRMSRVEPRVVISAALFLRDLVGEPWAEEPVAVLLDGQRGMAPWPRRRWRQGPARRASFSGLGITLEVELDERGVLVLGDLRLGDVGDVLLGGDRLGEVGDGGLEGGIAGPWRSCSARAPSRPTSPGSRRRRGSTAALTALAVQRLGNRSASTWPRECGEP